MAKTPKVKLRTPSAAGGWRGPAITVGVLLLGFSVLWWMFSVHIGPDEVAVRQVYYGPSRGMQQDPLYGPGLHLVIPGYERLHRFPRTMQTLDFNEDERSLVQRRLGASYSGAPAIRIQTSEGYQVTVDATILYRVVDPYTVVTRVGVGRLFESQVVQRRADRILRQVLGALNAEDFYNDLVRQQKVDEARRMLAEELEEWGIQLWAVLLREYTYDDRYQQAIEDRKIQDQRVFKNQAEALVAAREAERDRVLAEGRARIDVEQERGRSEVRRIAAEADLYFRQRVAEADLQVALAEAKGTQLENRALQTAGAANIVGLEMAKTLEGTEVIVISTTGPGAVNPLDLKRLLEGF